VLALIVSAGAQHYAIPSATVREVVPWVVPRPLPFAPPWVPGVIRYRRGLLPIVDLVHLLTGSPAVSALSTRTIVVRYDGGGGRLLGLLAEAVTTVTELDEGNACRHVRVPGAPFLGELLSGEGRVVQVVRPEELLTPEIRCLLFAEDA
jgi:chemotaxis-related protein WspB